jgi:hypothetical protein
MIGIGNGPAVILPLFLALGKVVSAVCHGPAGLTEDDLGVLQQVAWEECRARPGIH